MVIDLISFEYRYENDDKSTLSQCDIELNVSAMLPLVNFCEQSNRPYLVFSYM